MSGLGSAGLAVVLSVLNAQETIYDYNVLLPSGSTVSLSSYAAPCILIVNTASACGFTPQYKELQELQERFGEQLRVLAFPCNQFFNQEPGSDEDIQAFVKREYGIAFPVFSKIDVNGPNAHPLFTFLKRSTPEVPKQPGWAPNAADPKDVMWCVQLRTDIGLCVRSPSPWPLGQFPVVRA